MHALITADTMGGVWTYVRELVTGLSRRGVRVTLVSFGEIPASAQTAWLEPLENVDFRPTAFRLEWMQDALTDIEISSAYLASIVREVKPDLLHLNQYCYGNLAVDVPRIVVAHSDVVSWWVAVHGEEPPMSQWMQWYRSAVTCGLDAANVVVAPSRWMLSAIRTHYMRPENALVIYNGRNPNLFNPHITKEQYVLSVGRIWDAGKQTALLRNVTSPIPVFIAGSEDSPASDHPAQAKITTDQSDNLKFKGPQNETQLRTLYARASIYAATSRYEPFGLALVEAALSRCAVVANDIPAFREIWGDSVCYFRANDSQSLEERIEWLASDGKARAGYAGSSYEHARHRFTADRMVDEYLELYSSLVAAEATAA